MKLSQHTDYALRLLMYLGVHPGRSSTIGQIAAAYGISANHLAKIVQELVARGWVHSVRGRGGGLELTCDAASLSVGEIVRATERSMDLVECLGTGSTCPIEPACGLAGVLVEARDAFLAVLDDYTLSDLTANPKALRPLLSGEG